MNKQTIQLHTFFRQYLFSREQAEEITKHILDKTTPSNARHFIVDFQGIMFASRSFIDELLDSQEKLQAQGIAMSFTNVDQSVNALLKIVQTSRAKHKEALAV